MEICESLSKQESNQALARLATSNGLRAAGVLLEAGARFLVGRGRRLVKGVGLATLANVDVARAEEVFALLAHGEVVCGLVGARLAGGQAGDLDLQWRGCCQDDGRGEGQGDKDGELHFDRVEVWWFVVSLLFGWWMCLTKWSLTKGWC